MPSKAKRSTGLAARKPRTSSAKARSEALKANSIRSVPFHQLLHGRPEIGAGAVQMRMNRERAPAQICGLAIFAEGEVAERLPRERAEMMWIARERLATVGDGADVVLREITDRRPLVPALREAGRDRDQPVEMLLGLRELLRLHGLDAAPQQVVELRPPRLMPQLPERGGGGGGADGVRRAQDGQRFLLGHGR